MTINFTDTWLYAVEITDPKFLTDEIFLIDLENEVAYGKLATPNGQQRGIVIHPAGHRLYVATSSKNHEGSIHVVEIPVYRDIAQVLTGNVLERQPAGDFLGQPLPTTVGGAVTGVATNSARCRNLTSGATVTVPHDGSPGWDCEAAGLTAAPGDEIQVHVTARVSQGNTSVGGYVTGFIPTRFVCANVTTGDMVSIPTSGSRAWNCERFGLAVIRGDTVRMLVSGAAE